MTAEESGEMTPVAVDVEDEGFRKAVKEAVRPIVIGLVVLIAVVTLAGGIAVVALAVQARDLQSQNAELKRQNDALERLVKEIIATRTESRRTQCLRENTIRHDAGEAAAQKARDFIKAQQAYSGAGPSTGKLKDAEDAYIESQKRVTLDAYPRRDCSDAGIEAFYSHPPTDPDPTPCVPDGQGLCSSAPTP